ncbi:hypothetical protein BC567DRAFT_222772 [Phyllosticta citribraziliensis]
MILSFRLLFLLPLILSHRSPLGRTCTTHTNGMGKVCRTHSSVRRSSQVQTSYSILPAADGCTYARVQPARLCCSAACLATITSVYVLSRLNMST